MVISQASKSCYFSSFYRTGEDSKEKVRVKYKDD